MNIIYQESKSIEALTTGVAQKTGSEISRHPGCDSSDEEDDSVEIHGDSPGGLYSAAGHATSRPTLDTGTRAAPSSTHLAYRYLEYTLGMGC